MFDTNALIGFFNKNRNLSQYILLQNKIIISIISVLEFLSFKNLTQEEKDLIDFVSSIRKDYKLKLPDAIIASSAITNNAVLITNDNHFSNIPNL